jgi:hypothetical protein
MARPHRLQCGVDGFESGLVAIPYCTKQHTRGRLSTRHKILKDFEISGCRENPYTRRHCPEPPGTLPRAANAQACAVLRMVLAEADRLRVHRNGCTSARRRLSDANRAAAVGLLSKSERNTLRACTSGHMDTAEPVSETHQDQGHKQKRRENVDISHALTRANAVTPSLHTQLRSV